MSSTPEVTCPQALECAEYQSLLVECQEELLQARQLILKHENRNQFLRDRVCTLEQDLIVKAEELAIAQSSCDDLRTRLKREQHQCSQLKAALERCIDPPTTLTAQGTKPEATPMPEASWTEVEPLALFEESKEPVRPVKPFEENRSPSPLIHRNSDRQLSSFASVQLPKFPRIPRA